MSSRHAIVHVVHSLGTGGLENGVVNLINTTGSALRHVLICMTVAGDLRQRLSPTVEVLTLGKGSGHDPGAFVRLVTLLRRLRPSIVHSRNWATFDAVVAARLAGVPVVVHGEHGRDIADPLGRNWRRNQARRWLSPLVDRFVTVSHELRRWLVERVRVPAEKVVTIENGVDPNRFGHHTPAAARAALGLPEGGLVIGTVGRLDPIKDQRGLLHAFAAIVPAYRDAVLVITGDGPYRGELEGAVAALGLGDRVRLLGERLDVPLVLAALDVFVLSSIAEGMSNTLLEAMASGLPVVATRVGGSPELVEHGLTGRLVPPHDEGALAGAIMAYCDDPHLRTLHGKASRDRAVGQFSLERMSQAHIELYAGLLAGRRRGKR